MKKNKVSSFTTQYVVVFGILILLTNTVLGIVMLVQSTNMVQELVRKNMLNISNTAAGIVNGDELGAITAESVGSESWQRIYDELTVFQNNVDIEYIYTVRKVSDTEFVFIIDPDPEDPGEYGEDVLVTDALISAGNGVAKVDDAPAEDEWGNFYSAYSPVYDSKGNIAGIVGIDFSSEWYDRQLKDHTLSTGIITALSVLIGAILVMLLTHRVRKRFSALGRELALLSEDVDELAVEIASSRGYEESLAGFRPDPLTAEASKPDEIEELGERIRNMHTHLKRYLEFIHAKANTDALTHVGNTTAYMDAQSELEERMEEGKRFAIAVFDINDLKKVNDRFGHKEGDRIIQGAAEGICSIFGSDHTYRIGGDEFTAVMEDGTDEAIRHKVQRVREAVMKFNEGSDTEGAKLSLSAGTAEFDPEHDKKFRDVFVRADEVLYQKKREYHRRHSE